MYNSVFKRSDLTRRVWFIGMPHSLLTEFMKYNDFRVLFKTSFSQLLNGDKCHLKRVKLQQARNKCPLTRLKLGKRTGGRHSETVSVLFSTSPQKLKSDSAGYCSGLIDACRGSEQKLAGASTQKWNKDSTDFSRSDSANSKVQFNDTLVNLVYRPPDQPTNRRRQVEPPSTAEQWLTSSAGVVKLSRLAERHSRGSGGDLFW